MPKVAFFIPSIERGGVERSLARVLNATVNAGYEVDLVYRAAEPASLPAFSEKARHVMLQGAWPVLRLVSPRISTSFQALPGLIQYLRRERPQVLFSFQSSVIAVWGRRLAGVPTRLIVRESSVPTQAVATDRRWTARLTLPLKRWTYPQADAVVAISQNAAADLSHVLRFPMERIHVIYNPSFEDSVLSRAEEQVQDEWFQPDGVPIVLGVGRLSPEKDFSALVRAFAQARADFGPCRLVILGEGEERGRLEGLVKSLGIADSVALPGFVPNPYPYMARASVFVSPSHYEGLSNVIIESLALGIPVVSTRCPGGPAEILMQGKAGILVPVCDVEAMAGGIVNMLRDRELASRYVAEGQRNLDRFRLETCISKYLDLIESQLPCPQGAGKQATEATR